MLKPMSRTRSPLLCELHSHTTWSTASRVLRSTSTSTARTGSTCSPSPATPAAAPFGVTAANFGAYLAEIDCQAERALYGHSQRGRGKGGADRSAPARTDGGGDGDAWPHR